jgi:hypothetical protein
MTKEPQQILAEGKIMLAYYKSLLGHEKFGPMVPRLLRYLIAQLEDYRSEALRERDRLLYAPYAELCNELIDEAREVISPLTI